MEPAPSQPPRRNLSGSSGSGGWTPPEPSRLQAVLPAYEILRLIGRGGMGAVYEAKQKSLRRSVAIKVLPEESEDESLKFGERFRHEALALARLNHPGIVNVIDAGETEDGLLYFVMEYVAGHDLARDLESRERLPEAEAVSIVTQVAEALAYAHANGIVHRDIKPANILLDARGRVKVADFGLAKLQEAEQSWLLTRTGTSMGTPDYIAPEIRRPGRVADARADLFSLGVMFYQMLTGELPRGMFQLPSECVPGLDERWDDVICKALEPKPEDRYQSAEEMVADLGVVPVIPAREDRDQTPSTSASRLKAPKSVVMVGVAAMFGVAAFYLLNHPTSQTRSTDPNIVASLPGGPAEGQENLAAALKPLNVVWQDVSEEARSTAGSLTELVVDGKVIRRRSRSGPSVRLPVTPPAWRDYAIRITHVGDAQIDLRFAKEGFYFVLCQSLQTIFRKQPGGTSPGEALLPNRIHSPGFDINQPHELVAIVQGDRLRAWLDGRLVGDIRDSSYGEGSGAVMFVPQTELQRVEIAELRGGSDWLAMESAGTETWVTPGDGVWRDGLGEWIAERERTGRPIDFQSEASGKHVVQTGSLDAWLPADGSAPSILDGSIRAKAKGGVFRLSLRTWAVRFGERTMPVCYRAGFDHDTLKIWRIEGEKTTVLPGADYAVPGKFDPAVVYELEFRATGSLLELFLNGERILTGHDPAPAPGRFRFEAEKGVAVESLERRTDRFGDEKRFREAMPPVGFLERASSSVASMRPASPPTSLWTDWLGPRLAPGAGEIGGWWQRVEDGVMTERSITARNVSSKGAVDGAVRASYRMGDDGGLQIMARENGTGDLRELYLAAATQTDIYLSRLHPGGRMERLTKVNYPANFDRDAEHTLEFRCEGQRLTAILDGEFTITAEDSGIAKGVYGVALLRGTLLKSLEVSGFVDPGRDSNGQ